MKAEQFNQKMQKLMNNAWTLVRQKDFKMDEAMKMAWKVYHIKTLGKSGRVEFDYIKKSDGSVRHAVGTFNIAEMPADASVFKGGRKENPLQIKYFDVEKNGWRSCSEENIIAAY